MSNENATTVSFNVFGTLIQRPFVNPFDVFEFVGRMSHVRQFKPKRLEAEAAARAQNTSNEPTLAKIYDDHLKFPYTRLMQDELDAESQLMTIN